MPRPKTIMIDLDGVLATEERTFERPLAEPLPGAREALQQLRGAGHTLVIYTARGWAEFRYTKQWLDDHGFPYDGLHMGKPIAEIWIDDRALEHRDWDATLARLRERGALD